MSSIFSRRDHVEQIDILDHSEDRITSIPSSYIQYQYSITMTAIELGVRSAVCNPCGQMFLGQYNGEFVRLEERSQW